MLNLSFAGTLGGDPETRKAGQSEVTEFRVAVNGYDRSKREKTTTWLKVNIWGKRGEQLAGIAGKGDKVAGSGVFELETYTNRDGETKTSFRVTVQDLTLMGGAGSRARDDEPKAKGKSKGKQESFPDVDDDDIPF